LTVLKSIVVCLALANVGYFLWMHGIGKSQAVPAAAPLNTLKLASEVPEADRPAASDGAANLAAGSPALAAVQQVTRRLPIVFMTVADPVGAGYVASLVQPGGNTTGFMLFEYGISGKWLELLKQVAPGMKRTAVLLVHQIQDRDPQDSLSEVAAGRVRHSRTAMEHVTASRIRPPRSSRSVFDLRLGPCGRSRHWACQADTKSTSPAGRLAQ